MECPDISVIVTIYNKSEYLAECIESLVAQKKKKLEIILVNDGSTDSSLDIMQSFAERYSNITIIDQNNQGLSGARIAGYRAAKGKYIAWVDADDFLEPEMYMSLFQLAEENEADLVYCDYKYYPHKVAAKAKWFREYTGKRDWHFIDKNTAFWNKLFRKDLLERVGITELIHKYAEYAPIVPMLEASKICFTREQLYVYRVGHDSMSGGSVDGKVQHYLNAVKLTKKMNRFLKDNGYSKELDEYFDYRYIYTLLSLAVVAAKNSDIRVFRRAQKELKRIDYKNNKYLDIIVRENYGKLKSFVITLVIPSSYPIASIITKTVL